MNESRSNDWDSFTDWLEDERQIYWISGKPGSGKSTLMKYLFTTLSNPSSYPKTLVLSFWFWEAGVHLERSLEGCLRSLLWQTLKSLFIPVHAIGRIAQPLDHIQSKSNLIRALKECFLMLQQNEIAIKVLLDGVDECASDAEGVLEVFNQLAKFIPTLKICIASRPEQLFIDMLDEFPKLRLQNLNRRGIRKVIDDNLFSKPLVKRLFKNRQSDREHITASLASRAQGVFLWVHLTIRSLLQGITNRDDIATLTKRLENMPGDLEKLYAVMLSRKDDDIKYYKEISAFYFKLILHRKYTSVVDFCLAIDKEKRKNLLFPPGWTVAGVERAIAWKDVVVWINARTGGLLEAKKDLSLSTPCLSNGRCLEFLKDQFHMRVDFIHRTARTYLLTSLAGLNLLTNCTLTAPELSQICFETNLVTEFVLPHLNGDLVGLHRWTKLASDFSMYDSPSEETLEYAQRIWNKLLQQNTLRRDRYPFKLPLWEPCPTDSFPLSNDGTIDNARVFCRLGWYSSAKQILQDSDHILSPPDAANLIYETVACNLRLLGARDNLKGGATGYFRGGVEQCYHLLQYLRTAGADFSALPNLPCGEPINLLPRMLGEVWRIRMAPEFHSLVKDVAAIGEHRFTSTIADISYWFLKTTYFPFHIKAKIYIYGEFTITDLCELSGETQWSYLKSSGNSRIFILVCSIPLNEDSEKGHTGFLPLYGISQQDSDDLMQCLKQPALPASFSAMDRAFSFDGGGVYLKPGSSQFEAKDAIERIQNICKRSIRFSSVTEAMLFMGKPQEQIDYFVSTKIARLKELQERTSTEIDIARLKAAKPSRTPIATMWAIFTKSFS